MKVITTHIGSDFDSLASMVAASKLFEGAMMCFSGSASRNVREFLRRYQTRWTVLTPRKIQMDEVTHLIVVDTRSRSRIGPFASLVGKHGVKIDIFDHHPEGADDIPADSAVIESTGSTTSIIVEILLEKKIPISSHEATLFAMGIYEDTGGLTFGATTEKDFLMISTLRGLGADLTLIPSHVEMALNASERKLLDRLIENAWERYINGARVILSHASSSGYVEGLSLFVHRLRDYFDADVALASVKMDNRTYLVARSRESVLDVSSLLAPMGGGGHPQAASVTLHDRKPVSLLKELEKKLEKLIVPLITVQDVMTSPVMAVDRNTSIDDAYRAMIRYGHSALPVIREGKPVGIITRKDLDKARLHGFGHALVDEFMTEGIITIPEKASVSEAHHIMVIHNIGRLPVMQGKTLVGIVTRTDLLRALYPSSLPPEDRHLVPELPWTEDLSALMVQRLEPGVTGLLKKIGKRADLLKVKAYVVGGFVRDLILGRPTVDLDIVIEGDAVPFIKSWEKDNCRIAVHGRYRTGTVVFPDGRKIDIATARREFYEYPVAQPTVSSDSLKHDLYRRDFTINAMAITINSLSWGKLIDYFGGRRDIQRRTIKVLHNLSFVEDPTRILRGIRLEQRLGFEIEDNTQRLLNSCVRGGLLSLLSGFRLRSELELNFMESQPFHLVKRMSRMGVWEVL
ncbi:MAG: CBS domain-containing protein, partial [Synergistales bacterium]|nr:CBS domain-containing protein [Synergistales bacterium]